MGEQLSFPFAKEYNSESIVEPNEGTPHRTDVASALPEPRAACGLQPIQASWKNYAELSTHTSCCFGT